MNPPVCEEDFNKLWQCNCMLEFLILLSQEIGISKILLLCCVHSPKHSLILGENNLTKQSENIEENEQDRTI